MMVAMFMHNLFTLVDTFFVGKLGPEAIAAVAASFPVFFIIIALISGLGIGVNSFVARSIGARDFEKVNIIAENGLLIAGAFAILVMLAGLFTTGPLIKFLEVSPVVAGYMKDYISIIYLGCAAFFFGNVANSLLTGEGDTKTPMKALVIANIANIILDPAFIFGFGPIPAMGVKGAAIATILSQSLGALYSFSHLFSGKAMVKLKFKKLAYSPQIIKGIFAISIPTSASQGTVAVGFFFLNKLIATFGSSALAGFGIAARMESLAVLPALAVGMATLSTIGQNIGARHYDRARLASAFSSAAAFAFMTAVGLLFFFTAPAWLRVFTQSQEVISHGIGYFGIVSFFYGFIGLRFIATSSFQGLGKAMPVLAITSFNFALMIMASYLLAFKLEMGITGAWIGVAVAHVTAGIIAQLWFQKTLRHAERLHIEKSEIVVTG